MTGSVAISSASGPGAVTNIVRTVCSTTGAWTACATVTSRAGASTVPTTVPMDGTTVSGRRVVRIRTRPSQRSRPSSPVRRKMSSDAGISSGTGNSTVNVSAGKRLCLMDFLEAQHLQQGVGIIGHGEQVPMLGPDKTLGNGLIDECFERIKIACHVEQTDGFAMHAELGPGDHFEQFLKSPIAARESDDRIRELGHAGFASMHAWDHL